MVHIIRIGSLGQVRLCAIVLRSPITNGTPPASEKIILKEAAQVEKSGVEETQPEIVAATAPTTTPAAAKDLHISSSSRRPDAAAVAPEDMPAGSDKTHPEVEEYGSQSVVGASLDAHTCARGHPNHSNNSPQTYGDFTQADYEIFRAWHLGKCLKAG